MFDVKQRSTIALRKGDCTMTDDDLMMDQPLDTPPMPTRSDVASEALSLLLQGSLPRLILLLVWLGHNSEARSLLALQSSVLGILTSPPKKRKSLA